ncbi:MAG: hypothetical protein JWM10_5454 [Myxococcaceae bacterium]|nr:hypothetical protein [Myxococcaceae bacterium]
MSDRLDGVAAGAIDRALAESADEHGLADYYRDCVRPLLRLPVERWPRCCGGGCEPCSEALRRVAAATLARLGRSVVERSENG